MVDQEELHNQCFSEDSKERIRALEQIRDNFSYLLDKQQAWNDLLRLTNDENSDVRSGTAYSLGFAFSQVPNKQQAWSDLVKLTNDEDNELRATAAKTLGSAFSHVPDKQLAWNDLIRLTSNEDSYVRSRVASVLGSAFLQMPDKQQAWNDLHTLTKDKNNDVRYNVAEALDFAFPHIPDKQQAWNDLLRLTNDEYRSVRSGAAHVLGSMFFHMPDKQQALNTLIKLTNDSDSSISQEAVSCLGILIGRDPDSSTSQIAALFLSSKIRILFLSENPKERFQGLRLLKHILEQIKYNFLLLPDKQQLWNDVIKLINDPDCSVSQEAASFLGVLITRNPDSSISQEAASILRSKIHILFLSENPKERLQGLRLLKNTLEQVKYNFSILTDEQQLWDDVIKLINDTDNSISQEAALFLGILIGRDPNSFTSQMAALLLSSKIHILFLSDNPKERFQGLRLLRHILEQMKYNFLLLPDKQQLWNDVIKLINDPDSSVSQEASFFLGVLIGRDSDSSISKVAASSLGSKIHILCFSKDPKERFQALKLLRYSRFSLLPDKQQMWNDLIQLANYSDGSISIDASSVLRFAFDQVPDKQKVWNDLLGLTDNKYDYVKYEAASTLGSAFCQVNNKQKAWDNLHRLTSDQNVDIRRGVASSLGLVFHKVPHKEQTWDDLHRLIDDQDIKVKRKAASSLGLIFSQVPDKQQAWDDLHRLAESQDTDLKKIIASSIGLSFPDVPNKKQAYSDLIKLTNDKEKDVRAYANHSLGKICVFRASRAENEKNCKKELEKAIEFFEKAAQESPYEWLNQSNFCLPFYRSFHTIVFNEENAKEEVDKYLTEAREAVKNSKSKELLLEAVENLANALTKVQSLDFEGKKEELNSCRRFCEVAIELLKSTEKTSPYATELVRKGLPILDRKLKSLLEEIQEKAKTVCQISQGTPTQEIAYAVNKEVQGWIISDQEKMTQNIDGLIEIFRLKIPHLLGYEHIFKEIEGIRDVNDLVKQYEIVFRLIGLIPTFDSMPDHVLQDIKEIKEKTASTSNEVKYLQTLVDRLIESIGELQNPQECLDLIQQNLEMIKNDIPELKGKIDEVLYELYSPLSTDQKLKIAIPIIPSLVSYEMETNVPKVVAEKICELKNLVLNFKNR